MAEIATIARPYAEALFKASAANPGGASAWLDELAAIAGNPQLQQFADSPKATTAQVFDVMAGIAKSALPDAAKNFLRLVIENGRLSALPEIASQFRALKNASSGSSDAVVYSAFPIDAAALADLATVSVAPEPELIGGVRVVVGDEVLDTSVKSRLQQMKVALTA